MHKLTQVLAIVGINYGTCSSKHNSMGTTIGQLKGQACNDMTVTPSFAE